MNVSDVETVKPAEAFVAVAALLIVTLDDDTIDVIKLFDGIPVPEIAAPTTNLSEEIEIPEIVFEPNVTEPVKD